MPKPIDLTSAEASERRLRALIDAAIPDHSARLTVLLAVTEYGLACEKAGIRNMHDALMQVEGK